LIYWSIKKPGHHRTFIAYSFFTIILLAYQAPGEPRYMLAAWALMGIACGFGLYESGIMRDISFRRIIPLALILPITIMLVMCVHENRKKNAYILGREDLRSYYMVNVADYSLVDYMNTKTPENSTIIWCDPRVYLFQRNYIPAYPFDSGNLPSWQKPELEIVEGWRKLGVTHLGFTMAANYRAWIVAVILEQSEIDGVASGYMYIENNIAPGYKYEEGTKLMFQFMPMKRRVESLGPLTPRSLQLASYATHGIDFIIKDGMPCYRADIKELLENRADDIDVVMVRKLIRISDLGFFKLAKYARSEGILLELNYEPLASKV